MCQLATVGVIIDDGDYHSTILTSLPTPLANFASMQLAAARCGSAGTHPAASPGAPVLTKLVSSLPNHHPVGHRTSSAAAAVAAAAQSTASRESSSILVMRVHDLHDPRRQDALTDF